MLKLLKICKGGYALVIIANIVILFFLLLQEKDDIYDNNIKVNDITTLDHWKTLSYEELKVLIGSQPFYN